MGRSAERKKRGNMLTIEKGVIECAHCQHELEGTVKFGLDLIRCGNCQRFNKVETFARVQRITIERSVSTYSEIVDETEKV